MTVPAEYVKDERIPEELEVQLFKDAYYIAHVGASNPTAIAGTLQRHSSALVQLVGTSGAEDHPALQAIAGHLAFLFHQGLGPTITSLDTVEVEAVRYRVKP